MNNLVPFEPVDYLIIGHVTQDITPVGPILGGTATFSALTAKALGLKVGIVTSYKSGLLLPELDGIAIASIPDEFTTTFENIQTPGGRVQYLYHKAASLNLSAVPDAWRDTPIVHLGPLCQEVDPNLSKSFPNSFVGLTPQGWFRGWDGKGKIQFTEWPESSYVMGNASATVLSIHDVKGNEKLIEDMTAFGRVLVITEGPDGARVYWNGDMRQFKPPEVVEVDPVGAGDIFAASFFIRLFTTKDPWEATRFASKLAANSVTRYGLDGVPTQAEVQSYRMEILPKF
jgi:hypothetical protein